MFKQFLIFNFAILKRLRHLYLNFKNGLEINNLAYRQADWKLEIPAHRQKAGDTLIEVIIATVILGTVLFSAYTLSSRAFNLGQSARERSQATQLLQEQAEALRGVRDNQSWTSFRTAIAGAFNNTEVDCSPAADSGFSGVFHMEKAANGRWQAAPGPFTPGEPPFDPDEVDDLADFYTVEIEGCFVGKQEGDSNRDRFTGSIRVHWPRIGSDDATETSELYLNLTDRTLLAP